MERSHLPVTLIVVPYASPTTGPHDGLTSIDAMMVAELWTPSQTLPGSTQPIGVLLVEQRVGDRSSLRHHDEQRKERTLYMLGAISRSTTDLARPSSGSLTHSHAVSCSDLHQMFHCQSKDPDIAFRIPYNILHAWSHLECLV
jgi:hypothetical protein